MGGSEAAVQAKIDEEFSVEVPEEKDTEVEVEDKDIVDPGQFEGKQHQSKVYVDEHGDPGPDHDRYKKIYAKMKDYERKLDSLESKGDPGDKSLIEEMRKHNEKLQKAIDRQTDAMNESTNLKKEKIEVDALSANQSSQKELRAAKVDARDSGDFDVMDRLDEELLDLKIEERDLKSKKAEPEAKEQAVATPTEAAIAPEQQSIIDEWAKENPWYQGESVADIAKTTAAVATEREVLMDSDWKGKPYGDQLKEVQRRVDALFGGSTGTKDEPPEKKTGLSGVESSGGNNRHSGPKKVTLTAEQVRVAKGFGMTPEDYAKQMNII